MVRRKGHQEGRSGDPAQFDRHVETHSRTGELGSDTPEGVLATLVVPHARSEIHLTARKGKTRPVLTKLRPYVSAARPRLSLGIF